MNKKQWNLSRKQQHLLSLGVSIVCMAAATGISFLYYYNAPDNSANVALVYVLAMVLVARFSTGYWYGIVCSVFAVICVNYWFTYPFSALNFTLTGYPVTFIGMLAITTLTSTMTSHLTKQATVIAEREKLLAEAEMEKMRANLLRAISHDLRTPLTGIIGNSAVYLENASHLGEKEKEDIVTNIYNDSNWLLNMVENLLTVTRIQGDNFSISTSEESVEEVLSEALQKLHKRYPNSKIMAQVPAEFIIIPIDAILIEQVIINLLENALVHAESPKPIELIVEKQEHNVSFTIKDYGKGIPPEKLDCLFDGSSYTPSQSSDGHKGMGIGLSICKTIITAHHGTLEGYNHEHGAAFVFTLPKDPTIMIQQ